MEGLQLSFVTLPGVSTSYSITIGSTNNATKEVKIVSAKKYKKLKKRRKKKKKRKTISISPVFEESELTQFDKSPDRSKRESLEMADNITEGIEKFGDNNKAISYAFAKQSNQIPSEIDCVEKNNVDDSNYV